MELTVWLRAISALALVALLMLALYWALRFVAQVKSLTQLPIGLTNLINDATLDDGVHAPFVVHTTTAPSVRVYGIFVPLVRR